MITIPPVPANAPLQRSGDVAAPANNKHVPGGPAYKGQPTLADTAGAALAIAPGSQPELVPAGELQESGTALDSKGRLEPSPLMRALYPSMERAKKTLPDDVRPTHEGEAVKGIDGLLYIHHAGQLWQAKLDDNSIWLQGIDEHGKGIIHRNPGDVVRMRDHAQERGTIYDIAAEKGYRPVPG
jgi:hypothetical protein